MVFLLGQVRTFFFMLIFGFFSGLLFNIYQRIVYRFGFKKSVLHISDLLFGILLGSLGFLLLICINHGNLRFYVILAIILGFIIYSLLFNNSSKA